jgi:proline iminopeptidase
MRARIRDTEIYFDVDGAGLVPDGPTMRERPCAFVIHGGPGGDHSAYKTLYGKLAQVMQLVYVDQRGQGRSARGDAKTYTLHQNVEDMESLRQHLGLGQIVSIGTSYGGMVSMAHAARYPEAVSHLVLVATAAHAGYVKSAKQTVALRGSTEQVAQCEALFAGKLDTIAKLRRYYEVMGPLYSYKYDPSAAKHALDRTILSPEALNEAHGPGGFLRSFDLRPELNRIEARTLILAGRHDWICPPSHSQELHRLIPHADLRIFENSSHSLGGDEPDKFFDVVAQFVGSKG